MFRVICSTSNSIGSHVSNFIFFLKFAILTMIVTLLGLERQTITFISVYHDVTVSVYMCVHVFSLPFSVIVASAKSWLARSTSYDRTRRYAIYWAETNCQVQCSLRVPSWLLTIDCCTWAVHSACCCSNHCNIIAVAALELGVILAGYPELLYIWVSACSIRFISPLLQLYKYKYMRSIELD